MSRESKENEKDVFPSQPRLLCVNLLYVYRCLFELLVNICFVGSVYVLLLGSPTSGPTTSNLLFFKTTSVNGAIKTLRDKHNISKTQAEATLKISSAGAVNADSMRTEPGMGGGRGEEI